MKLDVVNAQPNNDNDYKLIVLFILSLIIVIAMATN